MGREPKVLVALALLLAPAAFAAAHGSVSAEAEVVQGASAAPAESAQPPGSQRAPGGEVTGVLVRIGTPARVRAGEAERTVVVVGSDAAVDGVVRENLVVVNGDARVAGVVEGDVVVVGGRLVLAEGARVGGDVMLHGNSTIAQAPGAVVEGEVQRRAGIAFGPIAGWLVWLSFTIALIAAGLLFAAAGGRQLGEAAALLLRRPGPVVVATLVLIAAVPILAILSFITLIGIPIGVALLVVLIPALAFAGYIVAAAALGGTLLRRLRRGPGREAAAERAAPAEPEPAAAGPGTPALPHGGEAEAEAGREARRVHPYQDVVLGVVLLQLVALIPFLGGLLLLLLAHLGAGALVYRSWLVYRRPRPEAGPGVEARRAA